MLSLSTSWVGWTWEKNKHPVAERMSSIHLILSNVAGVFLKCRGVVGRVKGHGLKMSDPIDWLSRSEVTTFECHVTFIPMNGPVNLLLLLPQRRRERSKRSIFSDATFRQHAIQ